MMRVVIAGYYGFGNLGDELILTALLSQLRSRYPDLHATVLSQTPSETALSHGVRSLSRWRPLGVARALWRADLLVLGGGGLLQDATSTRSVYYYLGLVAAARALRTPVLVYALGVESVRSRFVRRLIPRLFNGRGVKVTVRDAESKEALLAFGMRPGSVELTADPVFVRYPSGTARERFPSAPASALLIPRFPCPPAGRRLFRSIAARLESAGIAVSGALFQPARERPALGDDVLPSDRFLEGLTPEALAERVGAFDWIVSARFHGLVLAALAGRPFIGLGDPHKVGRFCATCAMPFLGWNATEEDVQEALRRLSILPIGRVPPGLDEWRARAERTLGVLDRP